MTVCHNSLPRYGPKFQVFMDHGSEQAVKAAGKLAIEGKEYVVQDGDIMHFRFNV